MRQALSSIPPLIRNLLRPDCYPHRVEAIRFEETHISWVILTGNFAYKLKKPVNFGFLDFSTLDARRYYCEEELRLNQRLAASLYIDVVPITGTPETPRIGGIGPVVEYAVRMQEFAATDLALVAAERGLLNRSQFNDLAVRMASFHESLRGSQDSRERRGSERAKRAVDGNFNLIRERCEDPDALAQLAQIVLWMEQRFHDNSSLMDRRCSDGFVRECHGDLHLGNLVLLNGALVPFDCIEFSEELRFIDVMSEIAFLIMDLEMHGLSILGSHFLGGYLSATGDYRGVPLLRYFLVYRAMVRAKIALLSTGNDSAGIKGCRQFRKYLEYAIRMTGTPTPALMIMHGYSGCGKSKLAGLIADGLPAIRLRSDVERKRIGQGKGRAELYDREHTRLTYEHLRQLAETLLRAGYSVVVDACFLSQAFREQFKQLADVLGVPYLVIDVQTSTGILRQRIESRLQEGSDPSDADQHILNLQLCSAQPLDSEEARSAWSVPGDQPFDDARILAELQCRLNRSKGTG